MKNENSIALAPFGYADKPANNCFYSILGPAYMLAADGSTVEVAGFTGPRALKWSGKFLPQIGDRVSVRLNGFGLATVVAFFTEAGWLGIEVACDKRPDWHVEQCGDRHPHPLVFGAEIEQAL